MDRFSGLSLTCLLISIFAWITIALGMVIGVIFAGEGMTLYAIAAFAAVGAGISTALLTGAIEVLIGIYQNTCPVEKRLDA